MNAQMGRIIEVMTPILTARLAGQYVAVVVVGTSYLNPRGFVLWEKSFLVRGFRSLRDAKGALFGGLLNCLLLN
nr:hypothetical protein [Tanacetum cinerariifolium]